MPNITIPNIWHHLKTKIDSINITNLKDINIFIQYTVIT